MQNLGADRKNELDPESLNEQNQQGDQQFGQISSLDQQPDGIKRFNVDKKSQPSVMNQEKDKKQAIHRHKTIRDSEKNKLWNMTQKKDKVKKSMKGYDSDNMSAKSEKPNLK